MSGLVFDRSAGGGKTRGGREKRCSQHLFHTISPCSSIFCISPLPPAPPPPQETQKVLRIEEAIGVDRSDSFISLTIETSHFISFVTVRI